MDTATQSVRIRKDLVEYARKVARQERRALAEQLAIMIEDYQWRNRRAIDEPPISRDDPFFYRDGRPRA